MTIRNDIDSLARNLNTMLDELNALDNSIDNNNKISILSEELFNLNKRINDLGKTIIAKNTNEEDQIQYTILLDTITQCETRLNEKINNCISPILSQNTVNNTKKRKRENDYVHHDQGNKKFADIDTVTHNRLPGGLKNADKKCKEITRKITDLTLNVQEKINTGTFVSSSIELSSQIKQIRKELDRLQPEIQLDNQIHAFELRGSAILLEEELKKVMDQAAYIWNLSDIFHLLCREKLTEDAVYKIKNNMKGTEKITQDEANQRKKQILQKFFPGFQGTCSDLYKLLTSEFVNSEKREEYSEKLEMIYNADFKESKYFREKLHLS